VVQEPCAFPAMILSLPLQNNISIQNVIPGLKSGCLIWVKDGIYCFQV
jgi:hypothetical protein